MNCDLYDDLDKFINFDMEKLISESKELDILHKCDLNDYDENFNEFFSIKTEIKKDIKRCEKNGEKMKENHYNVFNSDKNKKNQTLVFSVSKTNQVTTIQDIWNKNNNIGNCSSINQNRFKIKDLYEYFLNKEQPNYMFLYRFSIKSDDKSSITKKVDETLLKKKMDIQKQTSLLLVKQKSSKISEFSIFFPTIMIRSPYSYHIYLKLDTNIYPNTNIQIVLDTKNPNISIVDKCFIEEKKRVCYSIDNFDIYYINFAIVGAFRMSFKTEEWIVKIFSNENGYLLYISNPFMLKTRKD